MFSIDYATIREYVDRHDAALIQGVWRDPTTTPCGLCLVSVLCRLRDPGNDVNSFAAAAGCLGWPEELVRGLTRGFDGLTPEQGALADGLRAADPRYLQGYRLGQQSLLICRTMGLLPEEPC